MPARKQEPWFVPLGLLLMGGIGVVYHQILQWCWRCVGAMPLGRQAFAWSLVLLSAGALVSWGESRALRFWRRLALCLALAGAALLHLLWRADAIGELWGWVAMIACGVCGGGEVFWLVRSLLAAPPSDDVSLEHRRALVWLLFGWLFTLILPSMLMPYVGVLPGCLLYAAVVAGWSLWAYAQEQPLSGGWGAGLFGFVLATCVGALLATPGIHISEKGYLPVDRDRASGLTLETSRRVDALWVRGEWSRQSRWEYYSSDAHRWAEALVHPAMEGLPAKGKIWLLGGEDGTALREILRYPSVASVEVWSDRRARLRWFQRQPLLARRTGSAFGDPRVRIRFFSTRRAMMGAVPREPKRFHRIFVAMDRPWRPAVTAKTAQPLSLFLRQLRHRVLPKGRLGAFWGELKPVSHYACMMQSMRKAGWHARPYRSLGTGMTWGLVLAAVHASPRPGTMALPVGLRYLRPKRLKALFRFSPDEDPRLASLHNCDD